MYESFLTRNRYMRPGQEHIVYSLTDCIGIGGHYYNLDNMEDTLEAIVLEHYHGAEVTNADHPKAHILIMQWCMVMAEALEEDDKVLGKSPLFDCTLRNGTEWTPILFIRKTCR